MKSNLLPPFKSGIQLTTRDSSCDVRYIHHEAAVSCSAETTNHSKCYVLQKLN